jgi:hypothetical protein
VCVKEREREGDIYKEREIVEKHKKEREER